MNKYTMSIEFNNLPTFSKYDTEIEVMEINKLNNVVFVAKQ